MNKRIFLFVTVVLVLCMGALVVFASGPNFYLNDHSNMLYYDGYIQCQPSYNDHGSHAANGYIRYFGLDAAGNHINDTGRLYTGTGTGPNDGHIYSRSYRYFDSLDPNAVPTQFYYGFTWVPDGSPYWPTKLNQH